MTSNSNLDQKIKQSLIWYTTVPFLVHFLRFANSILLARILMPSDFGIIGMVSVILYYCDTFSNFGFGAAIIQKKEIADKHFNSFFTFNLIVSAAFFVAAQLGATSLANFFAIPEIKNLLPVYSGLFILTAFAAVPTVKLKRGLEFKTIAIIDAVKIGVSIPTSLTLALNGYGFWAIIVASLLAQTVALVLLTIHSRHVPVLSFNFRPLKELLNFSSWSFINGQFKLISDNADKLIIGKILGTSAVGFYDKSMGLVKMPYDQLSLRLANVAFASLSRLQDDKPKLFNIFNNINALNATLMIPIFTGLIWVSKPLTLALLGEKWLPIVACMQILSFAYIISSLVNPIISLNIAIGKIKQQTIIRVVLTCLLVTSLIYNTASGIVVVAINIAAFNIGIFIASLILMASYYRQGLFTSLKAILLALLPTSLMCIGLYLNELIFTWQSNWSLLLVNILIGVVIYLACILIIPLAQFQLIRRKLYVMYVHFSK